MILDYLQENTKHIHQKVEENNLAQFIIDHSISKDSYIKLLQQNHKFYHTIYKELLRKKDIISVSLHSFLDDTKCDTIRQDLASLGCSYATYRDQEYNFEIATSNQAAGSLYVCEGSMLGSLLIRKHLKRCPNLASIDHHYFFGSDIDTVLKRWNNFKAIVNSEFNENISRDEILNTALKTFEFFGMINENTAQIS